MQEKDLRIYGNLDESNSPSSQAFAVLSLLTSHVCDIIIHLVALRLTESVAFAQMKKQKLYLKAPRRLMQHDSSVGKAHPPPFLASTQ